MFIRINKEITIDGKTLPAGSVVDVDKVRRKTLVERGHATDATAPGQPEPPAEPPAERTVKVEKAIRR